MFTGGGASAVEVVDLLADDVRIDHTVANLN
jgi:hypothetical protein